MTVASNEIAMGNLDLSSRTEEQASALVRVVSRFRVDGGTPVGVVRPHLVAGTAR